MSSQSYDTSQQPEYPRWPVFSIVTIQSLGFLFRQNCQDQHKGIGTGSYLGMVHFHNRRINRVWHFSQPPRHANLRLGSSSTDPKGPQSSTPGGSFKSRRFDVNPVSDQIARLRVRWPLYKLRAQDGALDSTSRDPSNRGPGFEPSDWSIKVTLPKVVMWSNKQNGAASRP